MNSIELSGKIEKSTLHKGTHITILKVAAKDEYSMPSAFKLRSDTQVGNVGEEVKVACEITGFVKTKNYTDRNGQPQVFDEDNVTFSVFQVQPMKKAS